MSQTISSLKALFLFPFRDPNWRRPFLVGSVLTFAGFIIPLIPNLFVVGYAVQIMRRAIQGEALDLPAWDDWGRLAVEGLRALAVGLVYLLPSALVGVAGLVAYFAGIFSIPFLSNGGDAGAALAVPLAILVLFIAMFLSMLLLLLGAIPWPMATAHFVAKDDLGAAFRFREWWPLLTRDKLGYFIAWVVIVGVSSIAYFVLMLAYYTLILCIVIPIVAAPISFYLLLVGAALFGQTYRASENQLRGEQ